MKKTIFQIIPIIVLLFFSSCDQDLDTEGISRTTYYNEIELIGENNLVIVQNDTYTEFGALAKEDGVDVSKNIDITDDIDTSKTGHYVVSYYIENVDGFGKTITRDVFVLPENRLISDYYNGSYTGDNSDGSFAGACEISHLGNGLYHCDDLIGGRYNLGRGYGPTYKIPGYFYITSDGSSYEALLTSSPWGPWEVIEQSLTGTVFSHCMQIGTFSTPSTLTKE
ncbi:immunoglobulin-like domain-containing protein [Wenyingzhuangia sp.]|uniref:immunoglobulin-like domain-containing protein n=1 Tax=Wenyingzhuangia sp. TaxID=1964193 RepID=UPI00321ADCFA